MPLPLIAIVGRPNVGKSTLFNRLAGSREAIVSDVPGTTRDRLAAVASWDDFSFVVMDTGGLEPHPDDPLRERVKAQVEVAVTEADMVVFLTDVSEGMSPIDQEIALWLRRSNKPLVLAVNKVDNPQRELMAAEFYQLGMGDPLLVSAYHNLGIQDLMEKLEALVPPSSGEGEEDQTAMRLAIVGRPNVGKSMLLNTILGQERAIVSETPGTTRDAVDTAFEYNGEPMVLVDTAGIRRPGAVQRGIEWYSVLRAVRALQRCDIALLVMDASDLATSQDIHIAGLALDAYKGVVVVANKWDLVPRDVDAPEIALQAIRRALHFAPYVPVCFTSAMKGTGIEDLMLLARTVYNERTQRVPLRALSSALHEATARFPSPSHKGKPLIIVNARQIGVNPPTFLFMVNNPSLVHFSYQRFLENHLRRYLDYTHTHLRLIFRKAK